MSDVHLIPYQTVQILDTSSVIPEGVQMIDAPGLWDSSQKGAGNVVAILDTGCDVTHPDLKDRIIEGRNFTTDFNQDIYQYTDNNGHGTHVAGTIAATQSNSGVTGVAPESDLLIAKVLTGSGQGKMEWIVDAIEYATNWRGPQGERVEVISMSLGGPTDVPELKEAIIHAVQKGISIVCAAGNSGDGRDDTNEYAYPGAYNEVIQVGAINFKRELASFTNTNDEIDLVAPGVEILSTYTEGRYAKLSGTSMATPHISGAIALLKNVTTEQFERKLTECEIYAQLIRRTVPLGNSKKAEGNGLLHLTLVQKLEGLLTPFTKTWNPAMKEEKTHQNK
ncbi:S8 family peptidase [Pontibacillus salicampi]|uniref:S8 family peptidase n=1 Tax=Pontibacillus salicampi TaxID=1449801 RepID=A0ABV6LLI6_9BACI